MAELTVANLHLTYGDNPILKGVSMELNRGEVVSLLGPSGSGKTTLLRAVAGLEAPHKGTIKIGDRQIFDADKRVDVPAEARNLGLVFQSYALWPHKTVADNVAFGLKLRKVASGEIASRVQKALDELSLGHLAERFPHQLSGGQQQRVAIARALVYNPPVILMDEPLSNLDAKLREEARAWLRTLIVNLQLSALVVTHDQGEAMAMSDRILLLNNGVIEQQGTPQEMYNSPQTLFTADFMGSNNRLAGKVARMENGNALLAGEGWQLWGRARASAKAGGEGWQLWGRARASAKAGGEGTGMVRVERVRLAEGPGDNRVQPELTTSMFLGDKWEHVFHLGKTLMRAHGAAQLTRGRHWVEIPREDLWVF